MRLSSTRLGLWRYGRRQQQCVEMGPQAPYIYISMATQFRTYCGRTEHCHYGSNVDASSIDAKAWYSRATRQPACNEPHLMSRTQHVHKQGSVSTMATLHAKHPISCLIYNFYIMTMNLDHVTSDDTVIGWIEVIMFCINENARDWLRYAPGTTHSHWRTGSRWRTGIYFGTSA